MPDITTFQCRVISVFDLKTEKVIFRHQFDDANEYLYRDFATELTSWKNWTFLLVGCRFSKKKTASGVFFIVAAIKKQRVVMTGFTVTDLYVENCVQAHIVRRIYSGAVLRLFRYALSDHIYRKITLKKKAVNWPNVEKLKL